MAYDEELANRVREQLALYVGAGGVDTDDRLGPWVERGTAFARSLPPKG